MVLRSRQDLENEQRFRDDLAERERQHKKTIREIYEYHERNAPDPVPPPPPQPPRTLTEEEKKAREKFDRMFRMGQYASAAVFGTLAAYAFSEFLVIAFIIGAVIGYFILDRLILVVLGIAAAIEALVVGTLKLAFGLLKLSIVLLCVAGVVYIANSMLTNSP